jgi:hypothetical protein
MLGPHRPGGLLDLGPDVLENSLRDGNCPSCQPAIPGRWANPRTLGPSTSVRATNRAARRYDVLNL